MTSTFLISRRRALMLTAFAFASLSGGAAIAADQPLLKVISTKGETVLTEADFAALPQASIVTHTAWTEGARRFDGVSLKELLARAGFDAASLAGRSLRLQALNEYEVTIPAEDCDLYNPLLARSMDGAAMQRSDKGPIWLVYPRDDHADLHDQRFDHRWAWQLAVIFVD